MDKESQQISEREFDLLVWAGNQFFEEAGRLKELRWKITILIVSMLLGMNTFLIVSEINLNVTLSWTVLIISFCIYFYGIISLYLVEVKLIEELAAIKHCREKLGVLTKSSLCGTDYQSKKIDKLEHEHLRRLFMTFGLYVAMTLSLGANILFLGSKGFI